MRRTRHVMLPVKSWQYTGLMVVSLACLTLGLVSRDRGGRSGSLAGPELKHTAPHEVDACPNVHPFTRLPPNDEPALQKGISNEPNADIRTSVRSRISTDSRSVNVKNRVSRVRSVDRHTERSLTSRDRIMETLDRRSSSIERSIRSIGVTRLGDDRSKRQALTRSRSVELRENRASVTRDRRNYANNRQFNNADRRSRMIETSSARDDDVEKQRLISRSHSRRSINDVMQSRSFERRSVGERTDDTDRREKRYNGALRRDDRSINEREARENRFIGMSRSNDRIESRDRRSVNRLQVNHLDRQRRHTDVLARSRSNDSSRQDVRKADVLLDERRYTGQRDMDSVRRQARRINYLVTSPSEDVRAREGRYLERRASEKRIVSPVERQGKRTSDLAGSRDVRLSRSRDVVRIDVRREAVRSNERRSPQVREANQVERQERRASDSVGSQDVRPSRSRDVVRMDVRREAVRSNERRSSKIRVGNQVERQERSTSDLARSRDVRLSRSRDVGRVDLRRQAVRSNERRSSKIRVGNQVERQERSTSDLAGSRDVRLSRSRDVVRVDVRREAVRSNERRSSKIRVGNQVERQERSTSHLARSRDVRLSRSRDVGRVDVRRQAVRSNERRSPEIREANQVERQERRTSDFARSRDVQLSRPRDVVRVDVRRETARSDERRNSKSREENQVQRQNRRTSDLARSRDVGLSRSRDITRIDIRREGERSLTRRISERQEINPVQRQEKRINILARSRDVERLYSRDISRLDIRRAEPRLVQRRSAERLVMSHVERREKLTNGLITSRSTRMTQSGEDRRHNEQRSAERRVVDLIERQQRRVTDSAKSRDVKRADVRRVGIRSEERRSTERIEHLERRTKFSERLQEPRSVEQHNRHTGSERRMVHSAMSRNGQQSNSRDVTRLDVSFLGAERSQERRAVERQVDETSWVDSLRRHMPISRKSESRDSRDLSRGRRASRDITIAKKTSINSQQRSVRSPAVRFTDAERPEHLVARDISQERRGRSVEHNILRENRSLTREGRTSEADARDHVRQKRAAVLNRIRTYRMEKHPEVLNERGQLNIENISKLEDIRVMSKTDICDYLRQALILGLCAVYGISLLKGKGGSYSLKNIFTQTSRLMAW